MMLMNVMKFYELYVKFCPPRFVPWLRSWFPLHTPFLLLQCFPSIQLSSFVEFLVINPNQTKPSIPHICASTTKERCLYLILRKNFNVRCMGFYVHTYHSWAITWFFAQTFLQSYNQGFQIRTVHWIVKERGSRFLRLNRGRTGIEPWWRYN